MVDGIDGQAGKPVNIEMPLPNGSTLSVSGELVGVWKYQDGRIWHIVVKSVVDGQRLLRYLFPSGGIAITVEDGWED